MAMRLIASETGIDQKRLRSGQVEQSDWARIVDVLESLKDVKSWIDSSSVVTVGQMRARLRKLVRAVGRLGLVVVDYLQLVSGTEAEKENRAVVVSAISLGLKRLAKEFDVPVIALSQLSRSVDARPDKRPIMSDLRESGSIEQDGDCVLFVAAPALTLAWRSTCAPMRSGAEARQAGASATTRGPLTRGG